MAPGYRPSGRRQNRQGHADHDIFEGLPVRHWRRDYVTVSPATAQETTTSQNDIWAVELPYGMPKDSHLLHQHSQDLLRATRSGKIYKRPLPVEEEEIDPDIAGEKSDKKDEEASKGFSARAWKQIPRHMEGADVEYLAKRRKGVITAAQSLEKPALLTLTKSKIRRVDAAGNEYVQDVISAPGQPIEGHIISQTVIADPQAVGLVDAAPVKRKAPPKPPKRKSKGPWKGRKKVKIQAPAGAAPLVGGEVAPVAADGAEVIGPAVKIEDPNAEPSTLNDTEMGDGSNMASDDEEGSDGDDGQGDDEDGEGSTSKSPTKSQPDVASASDSADVSMHRSETAEAKTENQEASNAEVLDVVMQDVGADQVPLAAPHDKTLFEIIKEEDPSGSPLKAPTLTGSTLTSPGASPNPGALQPLDTNSMAPAIPTVPAQAGEDTVEKDGTEVPASQLAMAEIEASETLRKEEEEEEIMLLDIVADANAQLATASGPVLSPPRVLEPVVSASGPETGAQKAEVEAVASADPLVPTLAVEPTGPTALGELGDDDDESFTDLLGSLENKLNEPATGVAAVAAAVESTPAPPNVALTLAETEAGGVPVETDASKLIVSSKAMAISDDREKEMNKDQEE